MSNASESISSLQQEQFQLDEEIAVWRRWWSELCQLGQPHFGQMGDRLARFRGHLSEHFQHEEFRGPLSSRSEEAVLALWREHALLLRELDGLVDRLQRCGPDVGCWGGARREFEQMLDHLHAHEARQAQVVSELTTP